MKKISISFLLLFCISFIRAQTVNNTSYITQGGEKVLRIEMILRCDKKKAWNYFTKDELLQKWIAPLAHIELKSLQMTFVQMLLAPLFRHNFFAWHIPYFFI